MPAMKRSLVACMALLLGCGGSPSGPEPGASKADAKTKAKTEPKTDAKTDAKVEAKTEPKADAKADTKIEPEPPAPTEPPAPAPPAVVLSATTTALLDRLVPAAERAKADDAAAKSLEMKSIEGQLWVVQGSRSTSLHRRASAVVGVTVQRDASAEPVLHVGFEDDVFCGDIEAHAVDLPVRTLLARLDVASGQELHAKGEHEAAAKSLARGALLDPTLDDAWLGLAAALAKQGDAASAMAALEPMIARAPLLTYHHVLASSDLATLRDQPALAALRAPKAGNVALRTMTIAYAAHGSLVALVRTEPSWGACNYVQELRLYDAKTGQQVLSVPLAGLDETDPECNGKAKVLAAHRATVDARIAAAQRFLRDMGFVTSPKVELARPPKSTEDEATTLELPKAGVTIELDQATVKVRKGTEVLVERPQNLATGIDRGGHDPTAGVVFVEWHGQVPEGCAYDDDGAGHYVLPLPPASP